MTVKQIAEAVSKPEQTVKNWITRISFKMDQVRSKMDQASASKKPADYDIDETCAIIEEGLGKNAASLYRQNANARWAKPQATESSLTPKDYELIAGIVTAIMKNLDTRVSNIEHRVEERQALLPAPHIKPRDYVSKLVREHAEQTGAEFRDVWKELYREFGYRTNSNPSVCAKHRGMTVIDYIDAEGQIETLLSVAIEIFREQAA